MAQNSSIISLVGVQTCLTFKNTPWRWLHPLSGVVLFGGDMKEIAVSQGKLVQVSDEDYEELSKYRWCLTGGKYVNRRKDGKVVYMHREILHPPDNMKIDHLDHNPLNNQRSNLRICTQLENTQNCRIHRNNSTGYKGVRFNKRNKNYTAQITVNHKLMWLGAFDTAEQAHQAYVTASEAYFGIFSYPDSFIEYYI
jgi:hypothetical protein